MFQTLTIQELQQYKSFIETGGADAAGLVYFVF